MLEDASTWRAHDTESAAILPDLINREVASAQRDVAARSRQVAPKPQPSEAQVIAELVSAAMPAVQRDSKTLQRIRAANEVQRRKDEASWAREREAIPTEY